MSRLWRCEFKLEDDRFCDGCPWLDERSGQCDYTVQKLIGTDDDESYEWPRPEWCGLEVAE